MVLFTLYKQLHQKIYQNSMKIKIVLLFIITLSALFDVIRIFSVDESYIFLLMSFLLIYVLFTSIISLFQKYLIIMSFSLIKIVLSTLDFNPDIYSILDYIVLLVLMFFSLFLILNVNVIFFKKKLKISKKDMIILSLSLIFIVFIVIYTIRYERNYSIETLQLEKSEIIIGIVKKNVGYGNQKFLTYSYVFNDIEYTRKTRFVSNKTVGDTITIFMSLEENSVSRIINE